MTPGINTLYLSLFLLLLFSTSSFATEPASHWTDREKRILSSLSLSQLNPPEDASNRYALNKQAAALGKRIFFDQRFSKNGQLSCASCHQPDKYFTDGLPRAIGMDSTLRNTPTVTGSAYNQWFYWDGRRDSLWSQALIPFEAAREMGSNRIKVIRTLFKDGDYRQQYETIFNDFPIDLDFTQLPENASPYGNASEQANWFRLSTEEKERINRVYSNLGKAIAAYETTLLPEETVFDQYVRALLQSGETAANQYLNSDELAGARLFINNKKTQCLQCHNGPLFTNTGFHNIGTGNFTGNQLDFGRLPGLQAVLRDEFNCLGRYSDASQEQCQSLRFLNQTPHIPLKGAYKTPGLRYAARTAPYFHDGRFQTLDEVIRYYNTPPVKTFQDEHELRPLNLEETEISQLTAFLKALSSPPRENNSVHNWSDSELRLLKTLHISALPNMLPTENRSAEIQHKLIAFGKSLFSDSNLSRDQRHSCASCHLPEHYFLDQQKVATGVRQLTRNTPSLVGAAYQKWFYWDGRKDSLWSQALEPLESLSEMAGSRYAIARYVDQSDHRQLYNEIFGSLPNIHWPATIVHATPAGSSADKKQWEKLTETTRKNINIIFVNLGKALAAYESTLNFEANRLDQYIDAILNKQTEQAAALLTDEEVSGLRLFISGKTQCVSCHHGPRMSDEQFHNIGTADDALQQHDSGRQKGIERLAKDEFNCHSPYANRSEQQDCSHLEMMLAAEIPSLTDGAFRTPGLRGLTLSAPYMHDGRFDSLFTVLEHYLDPPDKKIHRHELNAGFHLTDDEIKALIHFLEIL